MEQYEYREHQTGEKQDIKIHHNNIGKGDIFIELPDYWIQIDTKDRTFFTGDYGG